MNEKHIITNHGEIVAIVANKEIAKYLAQFLPGKIAVCPMSNYDFNYSDIKEFMK